MWTIHNSSFGNVIQVRYENPESDIHQVEVYKNSRNSQWMVKVLVSTRSVPGEMRQILW